MNNSIIDKILTEWAFRVPNGMPDPKDPYHIVILSESLDEMKFPRKAKSILLNKLREESKKVYKSNWPGGKAPKGVKLHKGSKGGIYYFGNPETGEPDKEQKPSEKSDLGDMKGGVPMKSTDGLDRQLNQSKLNAEKTQKLVDKRTKELKEAVETKDAKKIAKAEKNLKKANKNNEKTQYQYKQMQEVQRVISGGTKEEVQSVIDESRNRVIKQGVAQAGGIAASTGESTCTHALNKVGRNYQQNKIGSNTDHTGKQITDDEKQESFNNETKTKRIEYAIELGLVKLSDEPEDNPPGYKPSPLDEEKQKEIGLELEKRKRFVDEQEKEIMDGDNEISEKINKAEKKMEDKCAKGPSKSCTEAKKGYNDARKNLREWAETGYDTGRSMIDDIIHDEEESYNPPDGFPDDEKNKENGTPQAAIMSPEMQALFRGSIERERMMCDELKDSTIEGGGERYEKCVTHYDDQLKNFDEGVSDHDTGMMYYDINGRLRFVNVSNKKTKESGTGESKKGAGDENRNNVGGSIDPHFNGTPKERIESTVTSIDEARKDKEFMKQFPGFGNEGIKVGSRLEKGISKGHDIAKDASKNVTTLQLADGQGATMVGVVQSEDGPNIPSKDSNLLGSISTKLPGKGRQYVEDVKNHKDGKERLEEIYGPEPDEGYTDEQIVSVAIMLMQDEDNKLPYEPYGKLIEKYGEIHNDVEDKLNNKGWSKEKIAKKYGITVQQVDDILGSTAMKECGALKTRRQNAMEEAHRETVNATKGADEDWAYDDDGNLTEEAKTAGYPENNGPYTQIYVKNYMKNMHWDKYIENLDGKKQMQIGGVNCKPADFRRCMAQLSGFDTKKHDLTTPEGKKALQKHMERQIDIDADTGAVRIKGEGGADLGYDTWRTAGTSPKTAGGLGTDLRKCLRKANNARQAKRREK